jgi:hypothetical protein
MKIRVVAAEAFTRDLRLRMPFRYGIVTMTKVSHLILRLTVEIDGRREIGLSADNLAPKWFTKNPASSLDDDRDELIAVIRSAAELAIAGGNAGSVFDWWQALTEAQHGAAERNGWPALLAGFGVSMMERAVMDAFCRARETTFATAVRENAFGIRLAELYPELTGEPRDFLPSEPLNELFIRHTVGMADSLTAADIAEADHVNDGLPQALDACIREYGYTLFKIKLSGEVAPDIRRLSDLAEVFAREAPGAALTLDANEMFRAVPPLQNWWQELTSDPFVAGLLERMIFLEQPLHRDIALASETAAALLAWTDRPPMIIDESDAEIGALTTALAGGYCGTSHKNCKGVIHGLANACLIAHRRRAQPDLQLSGEDLTNIGPVSLQQDLAVIATLGITHPERNGEHYFAGLSEFPRPIQETTLKAHPDLYVQHPGGFPAVRIAAGKLSMRSINAAPFGYAFAELPTAELGAPAFHLAS